MVDNPVVKIGDQVVYVHQHWVASTDEYAGTVHAVHDGGLLDIGVHMGYSTTVRGVRYDADGKPSSWHLGEPKQSTNPQGGVTAFSGFGSESTQLVGGNQS